MTQESGNERSGQRGSQVGLAFRSRAARRGAVRTGAGGATVLGAHSHRNAFRRTYRLDLNPHQADPAPSLPAEWLLPPTNTFINQFLDHKRHRQQLMRHSVLCTYRRHNFNF